jgi:hypothetical protein
MVKLPLTYHNHHHCSINKVEHHLEDVQKYPHVVTGMGGYHHGLPLSPLTYHHHVAIHETNKMHVGEHV